jgi:hypothetical protein
VVRCTVRSGGSFLRRPALLALSLLLAVARPAAGAPILDQQAEVGQSAAFGLSELTRAQTFTVGVDGVLHSVELLLRDSATRTFEIHATTGGVPVLGSTPLASVSVAFAAGLASWITIDFSSFAIPVSVGDVLAIVQPAALPVGGFWWAGESGYAGGTLYSTNDLSPGAYVAFPSFDFNFRTYVTPEPAAGLLAAVAALLLLVGRRGRSPR